MYRSGQTVFKNRESISSIETSGRDNEYAALSHATYMMQKSKSTKDVNIQDFLLSINNNLKLWTIFATDVAKKENPLPNDVKSALFYLFEFTQLETHRLIRGEGDIDTLIDINKSIMKGLRGSEVDKCPDL